MSHSTSSTPRTQKLFDVGLKLFEEVEERVSISNGLGIDIIGLPSTFESLNEILGGWRNKETYVIGSITGGGKSSFMLAELKHAAEVGASTVYVSLEMSAKILALRLISAETGIPAMAIEKGRLKPETLNIVKKKVEQLEELPLYIHDRGVSITELHDLLSLHQYNGGLGIVGVDYLGLVRDKGNPYERVTNVSLGLKELATDFDVPLLAAHQLNRASLSARPTLTALKESGQVENDAGAVIFPYRLPREEDDDPEYDNAEIIVAKNRHGPQNVTVPARFYLRQMKWSQPNVPIVEPPHVNRKD